MPISIISGQAGDYLIDTSILITSYKFSHFVVGDVSATVHVVKIRGVDVSTIRNYNKKQLSPGYVMSAGNDDYFDSIQFLSLGRVAGYFYPQPVSPVINAVTVDSSRAGNVMIPTINFSNAGNSGSKLVNWRVRNYTQEASIKNAAIQAAYDASGTSLGAFNFNELIFNANKTYKESPGTILQSGQQTVYFSNTAVSASIGTVINTSVGIPSLTYYTLAASDNIFDVIFADASTNVWKSSPVFQIYP